MRRIFLSLPSRSRPDISRLNGELFRKLVDGLKAIIAVVGAKLGCRRRGGGDGACRGAADRAKIVGLGEVGDGARIYDAAGDAAAHYEIAFELFGVSTHDGLPQPIRASLQPALSLG